MVARASVPDEALSPPFKLYLLAGGIAGALLGVMAAFLAALLDRSAKTLEEGQAIYDYPILGMIPDVQTQQSAGPLSDSADPTLEPEEATVLTEAYQQLQSNCELQHPAADMKSIVVTSAVTGEGKSEVAANLALTLSELGESVLLIDANLRSPSQHQLWRLPNLEGISLALDDRQSLVPAIVKKTIKLHILPVGKPVANPLAVLKSERLVDFLKVCRQHYDRIIIDSPALLDKTDALDLGPL